MLTQTLNYRLSNSQLKFWEERGFLILRGFFTDEQIESHNNFIEKLWKDRKSQRTLLPCDVNINSQHEKRLPLYAVDDKSRQSPYKLNDLYLNYSEVRELSLSPNLCSIIEQLLTGKPLVINTLNMEYGSEQPNHIDTFYMPPRVTNKMLASWIALEDVNMTNGPLRFYPRSHKIPPYRFSHGKLNAIDAEIPDFYKYIKDELRSNNINAEYFEAKAGDVLLWHAQLLLGGEKIKQHNTRKSLVTHYFRTKDQWPRFWRIRKANDEGYFLKRSHQKLLDRK